MSDIEKIIIEVNSSMSMEGMPLTNADKVRIRSCLKEPSSVAKTIEELLAKHTVPLAVR